MFLSIIFFLSQQVAIWVLTLWISHWFTKKLKESTRCSQLKTSQDHAQQQFIPSLKEFGETLAIRKKLLHRKWKDHFVYNKNCPEAWKLLTLLLCSSLFDLKSFLFSCYTLTWWGSVLVFHGAFILPRDTNFTKKTNYSYFCTFF